MISVDIVPRDDGNGGGNNAAVIAAAAAAAAAAGKNNNNNSNEWGCGGSLTIGMGGGSTGLKLEEPKAMRGGIPDVKPEETGQS